MRLIGEAKRFLTRLGPDNFFVRAVLAAACRRHGARLVFSGDCMEVVKGERVIRLAKRHMPYVADMAASFDAYFEAVVPDLLDGKYVVDYSRPRLQRYRRSGLQFEISSFPEELSAVDSYFHWYRPKDGDVIFDIGAYCGVSTYFLSKAVGPSGAVYAFEPDGENYELLVRNIRRHGLTNVTALPLAISGSSGPAQFHSEGALGSGLARNATRPPAGTVRTITTITFEDACRQFGYPAFAKVDIEGAEIEMLDAARDLLRVHPVHFALDTNHHVNGALTHAAVEHIFRDCGYEALSSAESGFMTTWARPSVSAMRPSPAMHRAS